MIAMNANDILPNNNGGLVMNCLCVLNKSVTNTFQYSNTILKIVGSSTREIRNKNVNEVYKA